MSDAPDVKEGFCATCGKLWATVTGEFFRYTKRGKEGMEVANEAGSTCKGGTAGEPNTSTQPERRLLTIR